MVKLLPEPTEEPTRRPAHSTHPPTYRREPDGAVDLMRTTVSPHSIHPPTYRWEPDGAVDLLRMTAYLTLKLLD